MKNSEVLLPILSFYIDEKNETDIVEAIDHLKKDLSDLEDQIKKERSNEHISDVAITSNEIE